MSHTVTVTRTTTSSTSTAVIINVGYFKTFSGLLKLAELILGAVCVGLVSYYYKLYVPQTPETFFLLMATAFLIGTFCLLLSCIISFATSSIIAKTIYEVVYHVVAFGLYLAASLTLLVETNHRKGYRHYDAYLSASIIGLVLAALYLLSTIIAVRSYRGL